MPIYQNSSVSNLKLIIGNCKIETAASAGATFVNLGAGIVNNAVHEVERYDVQAGNAPDPIEGVSNEELKIDFEMIEFNGSVLAAIHGGLLTETNTTTLSTIKAGGKTTLTPRAFRITNKTFSPAGASISTILTTYKATMDNGPSFSFKSDNDSDPIAVMPGAITSKLDSTRTAGSQLYTLTRTIAAS